MRFDQLAKADELMRTKGKDFSVSDIGVIADIRSSLSSSESFASSAGSEASSIELQDHVGTKTRESLLSFLNTTKFVKVDMNEINERRQAEKIKKEQSSDEFGVKPLEVDIATSISLVPTQRKFCLCICS